MTAPLISVIVPAYNRASLILETLESVSHQNYRPIELIIINDGSADNTVDIVNTWLEQHRNEFHSTAFHSFPVNRGKSDAVNHGFSLAQGEYVMVLDSDDLLLPNALSTEINFLSSHPNVDAVFAGAYLLDKDLKTDRKVHTTQHYASFTDVRTAYGDLLLKGNCIVASTVVMKRPVVKDIGGFRNKLRYTHDLDYWVRISKKYHLGYVNVPVLYYRMNIGDGSSLQFRNTFNEIRMLLDEHRQEYSFLKIVRALLFQTKYHVLVSRPVTSVIQSLAIALDGVFSIIRYVITRRIMYND